MFPARLLEPTVSALVDSVTADVYEERRADAASLHDETTRVLIHKLQGMPRHLSLPMQGLTLAFDWAGVISAGRPFHRQSLQQRQRQLRAWKNGPIGLLRTFVDFYEKMGVFVYCSTVEEREQAEE